MYTSVYMNSKIKFNHYVYTVWSIFIVLMSNLHILRNSKSKHEDSDKTLDM